MNHLKLIAIGIVIFLSTSAKAQVSVTVNVGSPPLWGPAGYNEVQYYYIPDVEAYYDVHTSMFIYYSGGNWIHRTYLPKRYRGYDLYNGYKVVLVDYHGNSPYHNHNVYKNKYKKGYRGAPQKTNGQHPGKGNSHNKTAPKNQKNNKTNSKGNHKSQKGNGGGKGKKH